MRLHLVVALLMLSPVFLPLAAADEMKASSFSATFAPDTRLTNAGNGYLADHATVEVFNLTAQDATEVPLNIETWPADERNGTYSGAIFRESVLQMDYLGIEKGEPTPYSYAALGSVFNWTTRDFMNGPVRTTVRLPWVGDNYDFMSLRVYEVDTPASASLSVQAVENGTVPVVTGGGANLIYENYLGFDWWAFTPGSPIFDFPPDIGSWPWRPEPESVTTSSLAIYHADFEGGLVQVEDRAYAEMHLYLEPDQLYYFATAVILADNRKPSIAITEENHSGGGFNATIIQGLLDDDGKHEELNTIPGLDLGWSFLFTGGHGAGLTGLQVQPERNQTVQFRAQLDPADGSTDNFSIMLPLINEHADTIYYDITIVAYNASGALVNWVEHDDPTAVTSTIEDNDLEATHFILYTAHDDVGARDAYLPGAGAEYYVVYITFNGNQTLDFRLLGYEGSDGFLVGTGVNPPGPWTVLWSDADYYAYNLSFSAKYTEGSWVEVLPDTGPVFVLDDHATVNRVAHTQLANTQTFLADEGGSGEVDLWADAALAWEKFSVTDPSTWGYLLDAIQLSIAATVRPLWNGMTSLSGSLHGAFSATADYLQQLGHFTQVYLGAIYDTVVNIMVHVYDLFTDILEKVLLLIGGIVFYFGLRLLLLVASYIKLALAGRPFE